MLFWEWMQVLGVPLRTDICFDIVLLRIDRNPIVISMNCKGIEDLQNVCARQLSPIAILAWKQTFVWKTGTIAVNNPKDNYQNHVYKNVQRSKKVYMAWNYNRMTPKEPVNSVQWHRKDTSSVLWSINEIMNHASLCLVHNQNVHHRCLLFPNK